MAERKSGEMRSLGSFLVLLCLTTAAFSQGITGIGENVNYWNKGNTPLFVADSLYLGGPFLRDTAKPFIVTYIGTQAAWLGYLYLMVPDPAGTITTVDGKKYTRLFIMTNHEQRGYQVNLTNLVRGKINHLDTVVFDYQTYWGAGHWTGAPNGFTDPNNPNWIPNWNDTIPAPYNLGARYSGPNRSPLDLNPDGTPQWKVDDRFWSTDKSLAFPNNGWGAVGNNYVQGRRWCVAGWINNPITHEKTDTVEFGFEDENDANPGPPLGWNGAGDKNFNDILYHVTGLFLIHPTHPASLRDSIFPVKDTLPAGDSLVIFAQIFDDTNGRRPEFDALVQWSLLPVTGVNTQSYLKNHGGAANNVFHAVTAYQKDTIITRFTDPGNPLKVLVQSIVVYVKPGPDYRVWIEPDANINPNDRSAASLARLQNPDHVPLVTISDTQNIATVDAVVRDLFGNFTHLATAAQWNEYPIGSTHIANVTASTPQYVGLIARITGVFGTTHAQAQQTGVLLWDTTTVDIFNGYIKKIRFVDASTGLPITGININTDQNITVKLQGVLSTDSTGSNWIDVTGTWTLTPNIASDNPIPTTAAGSWTFIPSVPGGPSQLTATTGTGTHVATAQIPVIVTRAPPSVATFTLLTPPAGRIAGDTILGLVTISSKHGLVPGSYCYPADAGKPASYQDTLGKGTTPDPTVKTSTGSGIINTPPGGTNTTPECFTNGVDTVKIVLYRAPYTGLGGVDTLHQLTVNLNGVTATTGPFKLLPGDLYSLELENPSGVHLTGTDTLLYPAGHATIYSVGYDRYGNKRGREPSNWSVTNTLHPLTQSSYISGIYYDASNATYDESGLVIARAARFLNGVFQDSLAADSLGIFIKGPPSSLDSAVTRDVNGNGYLDEIELYFNKPVTILPSTSFTITAGGTVFPVDSVGGVGTTGSTGTHFVVYLHEQQNGQPQTAWRPLVSITGMQGTPDINKLMAKDGAGPVIWTVTKTITNPEDRRQDVVTVTFSEPITGPGGSQFAWSTVKPSDVLAVYKLNAAGTGYDTLYNALDSITSFAQVVNDSTISFTMTNGNDITGNDYMNIKVNAGQIFDARGNAPVTDNRKAPVKVIGALPPRIVAVPNPSGPTFIHEQPGTLNFLNNPNARTWVRVDRAGTVITFKISLPSTPGEIVTGYLKIYDAVGNTVITADTKDALASLTVNPTNLSSAYDYDIYWNGSNGQGLKVAPGVYRTVVYLTYTSPAKSEKKRLWGTVGITY